MILIVTTTEVAASVLQSLCKPNVEVVYLGQDVDSKEIDRVYVLAPALTFGADMIQQVLTKVSGKIKKGSEVSIILV